MIEKKKTRKADLERKRFAFFQIGLILAGAMCLAAFEFVTPVFGQVEKQELEQDTVLTVSDIPIIFTAQPKQQRRKTVTIHNEVKLVLTIDPLQAKTDPLKNLDLDFDNLLSQLDDDGQGTFVGPNFDSTAWTNVDKMPVFPGNMGAWIGKNINLPDSFYGVAGTIYVSFVVDKKGQVTNVRISKSLDTEHDRAAMAVVKKMPKWTPGEMFGKPVAVNYHLPIKIVGK